MRWISGFQSGTTADLAYLRLWERDGDLSVRRLVLGLSPRFASTGYEDDRTRAPVLPRAGAVPLCWPQYTPAAVPERIPRAATS
jgi:hypothetical protein